MSLRFSEPLIMRFGPKRDADRRASSAIGAGLLLFARTPVDGNYVDRRAAAR